MPLRPCLTEDGSTTLYDEELEVHYRSTSGARREVEHVFIEGSRLFDHPDPTLCVLELGFGGATSFVTLAEHVLKQKRALDYHTVERRPVDPALLDHLKDHQGAQLALQALEKARAYSSTSGTIVVEQGALKLTLYLNEWDDLSLPAQLKAHAIFHDPFGPRANPEGWTTEVFATQRALLHERGRIATFGAASATRRAMCRAGLAVASLPGPGRKREITVAAHHQDVLLKDPRATILPAERYLP